MDFAKEEISLGYGKLNDSRRGFAIIVIFVTQKGSIGVSLILCKYNILQFEKHEDRIYHKYENIFFAVWLRSFAT